MAPTLAALFVVAGCAAPPARPDPPAAGPTTVSLETATPVDAAQSMSPVAAAVSSGPAPTPANAAPTAAVVVPAGLAAPRDIRPVGGIEFARIAGVADLYVEGTVAAADIDLISAQVVEDVRSVEGEFGISFHAPPEIYVFAATASYAQGMARIFGYPARTADWIAENSVAFFEPPLGTIAVNWDAVGDRRPVAAFRHELTHLLTLSACEPRCDLVPAWLNEGQGRLAEAYIPGGDWRKLRVKYEAASMATTGTLFPLNALVTQGAWNGLTGWAGYYKYQQAARVVELLREDVGGDAPIARVYERIRRGESIATAYTSLTGRSFASFVAGLDARLRSGAGEAGIVTISAAPDGPGASYLLYGFEPSSEVDVTISGETYVNTTVEVSPYGAAFQALPHGLPRGTYLITAVDGDTTLTATVVKSARRGTAY